jgi:hypothetical protein
MVTALEDDDVSVDEPLTTKEGWRRFVDRQPTPPALHDPATLAGMSARERDEYDGAITRTCLWRTRRPSRR